MTKKRVFDVVRVVVCLLALWIVVRGVTYHDRVHLANGEVVKGTILEVGEPVTLRTTAGERVSYPRDTVALDDSGEPRIELGLRSAWTRSHKVWFLLALLFHLPVVFFQGVRLRWMLGAQSIDVGLGEAVKLSWAGNFLNFATPLGSNAGDVFKAYFVCLHTDRKTEAVTTVVLDRVVGLATLLGVVAVITLFAGSEGRITQVRPYVLGVVGVGVVAVALYLSPHVRKYLVPHRLLARLPMYDQLLRMDAAARAFAGHRAALVGSILITVLLQALAMAAYFTVALAIGLDAGMGQVFEFYSYFLIGCVIQALPGPPQGLGTVELAYRYFFAPYGTVAQIVFMAFVIRLVVLAVALPGLLVTLTGGYRPSRAAAWGEQDPAASTLSVVPTAGTE